MTTAVDSRLECAVQLLARYTHRFDPWELAGPANRRRRQEVMTVLMCEPGSRPLPVSKCGVTAIRSELHRRADIFADCAASREDDFTEMCLAMLGGRQRRELDDRDSLYLFYRQKEEDSTACQVRVVVTDDGTRAVEWLSV